MTTTRTDPDAIPWSVVTEGFLDRTAAALRKLWGWLVALPDRGDAARPDDVTPEFYRFPPF